MLVNAIVIARPSVASASDDFIRVEGQRLVDGRGQAFDIKGINLGNWLVPEGYMFKFTHARAPGEIASVIETLIGAEDASRFWSEFRNSYITEHDIRFIKAAGFNTVRVRCIGGSSSSPARGASRIGSKGRAGHCLTG